MADISAWSPLDESNVSAPPDGWPEGMQPSGVNNSARAMMGATRRFYDTLTNGSFTFNTITCAGNITGAGTISGGGVSSTGNMYAAGTFSANTITGGTVNSTGGITASGTVTGATVNSTGTINAAGTITGGTVNSTGNIHAVGSINADGNMNATGTLTAGTVNSNGNMLVAGTLNASTVAATGTASANLLTANSISSNNTVNAIQYNLRGAAFATMDAPATYVRLNDPGGQNILLFANGDNYYDNTTHFFRSRGGVSNYCFFHGGGTFNASGSWNVFSDDSIKQNVLPYTAGLAQVKQLNPVSFEYTRAAPLRTAGETNYGLLASEVQPVVPEMVGTVELDIEGGPSGPVQTLMPTHLVYLLINAVKELSARVEQLEEGVIA